MTVFNNKFKVGDVLKCVKEHCVCNKNNRYKVINNYDTGTLEVEVFNGGIKDSNHHVFPNTKYMEIDPVYANFKDTLNKLLT